MSKSYNEYEFCRNVSYIHITTKLREKLLTLKSIYGYDKDYKMYYISQR